MRFSFLAFTLLAACAGQGDEGMYILNNTAPPLGGGCVLTSDPGQPFIAHGTVDSAASYVLTPLVKSRITAVAGQEDVKTIHVEGANVTLSTGAAFSVATSGSIAPSATSNFIFELIPHSEIQGITSRTEITANVVMYGHLGNTHIEAEPFVYGVTVEPLFFDAGPCATAAPATAKGDPCNIGQDADVQCCEPDPTNPTSLLCPGP